MNGARIFLFITILLFKGSLEAQKPVAACKELPRKKFHSGFWGGVNYDRMELSGIDFLGELNSFYGGDGPTNISSRTHPGLNWGMYHEIQLKGRWWLHLAIRAQATRSVIAYHLAQRKPVYQKPSKATVSLPLLINYKLSKNRFSWNFMAGLEPRVFLQKFVPDLGLYFATGPAWDVWFLNVRPVFFYSFSPFPKRVRSTEFIGHNEFTYKFSTVGVCLML